MTNEQNDLLDGAVTNVWFQILINRGTADWKGVALMTDADGETQTEVLATLQAREESLTSQLADALGVSIEVAQALVLEGIEGKYRGEKQDIPAVTPVPAVLVKKLYCSTYGCKRYQLLREPIHGSHCSYCGKEMSVSRTENADPLAPRTPTQIELAAKADLCTVGRCDVTQPSHLSGCERFENRFVDLDTIFINDDELTLDEVLCPDCGVCTLEILPTEAVRCTECSTRFNIVWGKGRDSQLTAAEELVATASMLQELTEVLPAIKTTDLYKSMWASLNNAIRIVDGK